MAVSLWSPEPEQQRDLCEARALWQPHVLSFTGSRKERKENRVGWESFSVYWRIMLLIMQAAHYFLLLINLFGFPTLSPYAVSTSQTQNKTKWEKKKETYPTAAGTNLCQHMGERCCWCRRETCPKSDTLKSPPPWYSSLCQNSQFFNLNSSVNVTVNVTSLQEGPELESQSDQHLTNTATQKQAQKLSLCVCLCADGLVTCLQTPFLSNVHWLQPPSATLLWYKAIIRVWWMDFLIVWL